MKRLRVLFFGTPQLSADILSYLLTQEEYLEIIGVVSNPDKIGGRGHKMIESPVAQLAREKNIVLLQPEKIKNEAFLNTVRDLAPDVCIVVAYGKILPQVILDIPPMGFLNVHTSLLPKYRGAAPIQHALMHGEKTTGLTIMQMSLGMDEGDILLQETWHISPADTTGSLFALTGKQAGPLLVETLRGLQNGDIIPLPQDDAQATYTTMIQKKDGELNPIWTLQEAYQRWQAYTPWPGLSTHFHTTRVTLLEIETLPEGKMHGEGTWSIVDGLPTILLQDGLLLIKKIHPAGKKPMSGEEFVRGFMKQL